MNVAKLFFYIPSGSFGSQPNVSRLFGRNQAELRIFVYIQDEHFLSEIP